MENQKVILQSQHDKLDKELTELRQQINNKRNHIEDLQTIVEKTKRASKKIAWYVYILILVHFMLMLYGWSQNKGVVFTGNLVMHYYLLSKVYRDIYMKIAMPCSLFMLVMTLTMY